MASFRPYSWLRTERVPSTNGFSRAADEIAEAVRSKRGEWTSRGIPETVQSAAVRMAQEWGRSTAPFHLEILRTVLPHTTLDAIAGKVEARLVRHGLDVSAENWLKSAGYGKV